MDLTELKLSAEREIAQLPDLNAREEVILHLNGFHEALVDWWAANPQLTLRDCSQEFGYSPSWLCTVMQTDLFKERLAKRQEELFGEVRFTVRDRLEAIAHTSLKRILERVPLMRDDDLRGAADMALEAMGITGSRSSVKVAIGPQQTNNTFVVSKGDLESARQLMAKAIEQLPSPPFALPASIEKAANGDD